MFEPLLFRCGVDFPLAAKERVGDSVNSHDALQLCIRGVINIDHRATREALHAGLQPSRTIDPTINRGDKAYLPLMAETHEQKLARRAQVAKSDYQDGIDAVVSRTARLKAERSERDAVIRLPERVRKPSR